MIRRVVIVAIVVILVIALAAAAALALGKRSQNGEGTPTPSVTASSASAVTPTPSVSATESESPSPSPSPSPHVTPKPEPSSPSRPVIKGAAAVVTLASHDASKGVVLVGGFVSGVMEDGATCTFTVTAKDTGATTTFESTGAFNVDSTTCGSHEVTTPTSKTGSYSVTLDYSNATGAVKSSPVPVEGS